MSQSLGKGLESLIPKKGDGGVSSGDTNSASTNPQQHSSQNDGGQTRSDYQPEPVQRAERQESEQDSRGVEGVDVQVSKSTPPSEVGTSFTVSKRDNVDAGEAVFYLEVEKITPNKQQPRTTFDEEALNELAASIREYGIIQPLVVEKHEEDVPNGTKVEYSIIAGHRRFLAAQKVGLERVPAVVRPASQDRERLELAVIENIQREDLNVIEMARAFARLQDEFRLTQREIATRLGKSRETIANTLRLLDLPTDIQEALERGEVSGSHGRILLGIDDPELQREALRMVKKKGMTTRDLRNFIRSQTRKKNTPSSESSGSIESPRIQHVQERLSEYFGAPVKVKQKKDRADITITFYSDEELEGLIQRLGEE